jgi:(p)ppGpp synthase/HD superfamily hydrolase
MCSNMKACHSWVPFRYVVKGLTISNISVIFVPTNSHHRLGKEHMAKTETFAQTNMQLYCQMREAGFSKRDLQFLQRDYATAILLFANKVRSTGRPFLCHAVGTASVALAEGADILLVRVALLHAAYRHGRFHDHKNGRSDAHRAWLRERTNDEVEQLILEFGRFPFDKNTVRARLDDPGAISDHERDLWFLKICNEVDDSSDYAAQLGHKSRYQHPFWLPSVAELAGRLRLTKCQSALAVASMQMSDTDWLDADMIMPLIGHRQHEISAFWRRYVRRLPPAR